MTKSFASRPLCGKQASYRLVSTTVGGDHVGIPGGEINNLFALFLARYCGATERMWLIGVKGVCLCGK